MRQRAKAGYTGITSMSQVSRDLIVLTLRRQRLAVCRYSLGGFLILRGILSSVVELDLDPKLFA
jgi:hypothetical protein